MTTLRHFIGLDLGQAQDYSAFSVLERPCVLPGSSEPRPVYALRHLQRWPLGTRYPAIVSDVVQMLDAPELRDVILCLDETGVGKAIVDMFVEALVERENCYLAPITITAGHHATMVEKSYHVPKKELVGALQALLQTQRLKVAASLPEVQTLLKELQTFKVKITTTARETFEAWRERDHDDLVLSVAMAAWMGELCLPKEEEEPEESTLVMVITGAGMSAIERYDRW